jgi:hypothetical protein
MMSLVRKRLSFPMYQQLISSFAARHPLRSEVDQFLLWGFNIRLDQRASSSVLKAQQPRAAGAVVTNVSGKLKNYCT